MPRRAPTNQALFDLVQSWLEGNYPGLIPDEMMLELRDPHSGRTRQVRLPLPQIQIVGQPAPIKSATHSPDFRSVHWFGQDYQFTAFQAAVVAQLWEAWEHGAPDVGGQFLLENAGDDVETKRLDQVFRDHPAWKTMIVSTTRGAYRLEEPI